MDLWVLVVGIAMTVVGLALAGRRVLYLFRLITSGQPAPDRVAGVTKRLGRAIGTQVVEVFGQKKLLKWTIPGTAHFFVFWAFLILGTVYLEAYGALFTRELAWHFLVFGTFKPLGFLQDFIAVMCLLGLLAFWQIRLKNSPAKLGRDSRFSGSHLGGAYLVLFMIFNVIWTLFLFRGAVAAHEMAEGEDGYGKAAFVSHALGTVLPDSTVLIGIGLLLHIGVMLVFLVDVVLLQAPAHLHRAAQRAVLSSAAGAGRRQAADERRQAAHPRRRRRPRRGRQARRRLDRGLQLEGPARLRDLHRVRALPVAVPGVEHREAALAEDADHDAARPRDGEGSGHPRRPRCRSRLACRPRRSRSSTARWWVRPRATPGSPPAAP